MVRKARVWVLSTLCAFSLVTGTAAADTPIKSIEVSINAVIETMKDKTLSLPPHKQERRDRIRALIRDRFDFEEMSKRSLARHWKARTAEEKAEFVRVFSELLETSYINKIEAYTNEKITYDKETMKGKDKYAVVNTTINAKDVDIPIDYKVIRKKDKWWVYDVIIEGVSFISTYRSQYNKIIVRESYAELIKSMKSKLEETTNTDAKGDSSS